MHAFANPVTYIIVKLSARSIRNGIRKIPANFTWRFFCVQADANASVIVIDWIIPCAWKDGYSVSIFALVGGLGLVASYSFRLSLAISCAGYYYYYCLSDNRRWLSTTIDEGGSLPLDLVFWWRRVTTSGIIRACICCSSGLRVPYLPFCTQVWLSLSLSLVNA